MSALGAPRVLPPAGGAFNYFWLIPVFDRNQKGEFRPLRRATQGAALRTRKPLKRFDRNFNMGAVLILTMFHVKLCPRQNINVIASQVFSSVTPSGVNPHARWMRMIDCRVDSSY